MPDTTTLPPSLSETPEADAPPVPPTLADLLERLGVGPERVLLQPPPGTATEDDVVWLNDRTNRLAELVEGTLVEKAMGFRESFLAMRLAFLLMKHVEHDRQGVVVGADGMMRILTGLVRIPDVAYVSYARLPGGRVPEKPIPALAPDLAVEVVSKSNSPREMRRKLEEYFDAGVRLVWYVYPIERTLHAFTAVDAVTVIDAAGTVDGGEVLPAFRFAMGDLFSEDRQTGSDAASNSADDTLR